MRIFRIVLQVQDLDRAASWYGALLGDAGRRIPGNRQYFDCGDVILALLDTGAPPVAAPDHVYFAVDDLEAIHARAAGALSQEQVHGEPAGDIVVRPWRERSFYAFDPWGNPLCFVDAKTLFTGRR